MMADGRRRNEQIAFRTEVKLEELVTKLRQSRVPTSVYVNPDDETQTWSGKGQNPPWLKDWLVIGVSMEELLRQGLRATRREDVAE
jgi:DNA-binding protein H-NS